MYAKFIGAFRILVVGNMCKGLGSLHFPFDHCDLISSLCDGEVCGTLLM